MTSLGKRRYLALPRRALVPKGSPILSDKSPDEIADYISKWHGHLTRWFGPRMAVSGRSVLVIGSQYGPELLWAIRSGARRIVGLDPEGCPLDGLNIALDRLGLTDRRHAIATIAATSQQCGDIGPFDYVMSNNVFEHVDGLSHTLASVGRLMPNPGARLVIFADPLFLSSQGHHLRAGPWEHLVCRQDELRARVPPRQWAAYRRTLNGMTVTSFLEAVREAGLILLDLEIVADRNLATFREALPHVPPGLKPMDLCLEGIACTLAFPHNLG